MFGLWLISMGLFAQNLQLHYDFRNALHSQYESNNFLTSTFEMFKPDKWGSTFLFVDFNYNQDRGNIGLAYWEIARDIKISTSPIMAHIEYNGGVGNAESTGFSIANAYLVGPSYTFSHKKTNIGTYLVYKYIAFEKTSHDVQWTLTWFSLLFNNKVTLAGFFDVWTEDNQPWSGNTGKKTIFITEPQIWYNVTSCLSFGSEVEISNNFHLSNKVYVCPTIAGKWTF